LKFQFWAIENEKTNTGKVGNSLGPLPGPIDLQKAAQERYLKSWSPFFLDPEPPPSPLPGSFLNKNQLTKVVEHLIVSKSI